MSTQARDCEWCGSLFAGTGDGLCGKCREERAANDAYNATRAEEFPRPGNEAALYAMVFRRPKT